MIVPVLVTLNLSSDASSSRLYLTNDPVSSINSIVKFEPVVIGLPVMSSVNLISMVMFVTVAFTIRINVVVVLIL